MGCKHRDKFGPTTVDGISRQTSKHVTTRCYKCDEYMPLGPSNDHGPAVRIEMRAAALHAGYEDASDTDDVIDDPVTRNVIEHLVGLGNLSKRAEPVAYLASVMASDA